MIHRFRKQTLLHNCPQANSIQSIKWAPILPHYCSSSYRLRCVFSLTVWRVNKCPSSRSWMSPLNFKEFRTVNRMKEVSCQQTRKRSLKSWWRKEVRRQWWKQLKWGKLLKFEEAENSASVCVHVIELWKWVFFFNRKSLNNYYARIAGHIHELKLTTNASSELVGIKGEDSNS